jgi:Zn-dependent peptidase ImmA (M78 family)
MNKSFGTYHSVQELKNDLTKYPFNREVIYDIMRSGLTIKYDSYRSVLSIPNNHLCIEIMKNTSFEEKDFTIIHELVHAHHLTNFGKFFGKHLESALEEVINNEAQNFLKNDPSFIKYIKRFANIDFQNPESYIWDNNSMRFRSIKLILG